MATFQRNISQHCWAQHVACDRPPCCDVLGVVGSKMVKFLTQHLVLHVVVVVWQGSCSGVAGGHEQQFDFQLATFCNTSQHGGQTMATCCAPQCCDMLRRNVAIVWSGFANTGPTMLRSFGQGLRKCRIKNSSQSLSYRCF